MGRGGDYSSKRAPSEKPPFTISQLKKAVPAHCFNRSLVKSSSYLIVDLIAAGFLLYLTRFTSTYPMLWPVYWAMQGCILTGVWVIAHECGHHAFSDYAWVDNTVGLFLHSCLMVPFFSWKYSHRRHHSNTASMEYDEVFVPKLLEQIPYMRRMFSNNPVGRVVSILITLTVGWPAYLLFNVSGRKYARFANHFDPNAPIFNNREKTQVLISDLALIGVVYALYRIYLINGLLWLINVYGIPLLIVNGFLVTITYLQHTHSSLPHYTGSEWEWLRGALSTVDRDYGILNYVFHHITDTHIAHHIFSTMPHYHAMEATQALKPVLKNYYQFDSTPVLKAIWREFTECVYVHPDSDSSEKSGILWYGNKFE